MESMWLRCKVFPGMFSHEYLVVVEVPGRGELVSILVDASIVEVAGSPTKTAPAEGRLRVQASLRGDRWNVMLPVTSAEYGRVVSVPSELIADH